MEEKPITTLDLSQNAVYRLVYQSVIALHPSFLLKSKEPFPMVRRKSFRLPGTISR